jgi:hypothetical protein
MGTAASIVFAAVFVEIGALISKTTEACWSMAVPVTRPPLGWIAYWT